MSLPGNLVHHDIGGDVDVRVVVAQFSGDGHREAGRVRGGKQLLRRRLALGARADPNGQRVVESRERAGAGVDASDPTRVRPFPDNVGVALDAGH